SFTYLVTDAAAGESSTQTVAITVNPVNDLPVAVDDTGTMSEDDTSKTFDVRANDTLDPDAGASNNIAVFAPIIAANSLGIDANDLVIGVHNNQVDVHLLGTDWQKLNAGESLDITVQYALFGNGFEASGATLTVTVEGADDNNGGGGGGGATVD